MSHVPHLARDLANVKHQVVASLIATIRSHLHVHLLPTSFFLFLFLTHPHSPTGQRAYIGNLMGETVLHFCNMVYKCHCVLAAVVSNNRL